MAQSKRSIISFNLNGLVIEVIDGCRIANDGGVMAGRIQGSAFANDTAAAVVARCIRVGPFPYGMVNMEAASPLFSPIRINQKSSSVLSEARKLYVNTLGAQAFGLGATYKETSMSGISVGMVALSANTRFAIPSN
jgi:hypothetical protein